MDVNELRVVGHFEIPDARVRDEVEVTLRCRIYSIEVDRIDVSAYGGEEYADGGLRVMAVSIGARSPGHERPSR